MQCWRDASNPAQPGRQPVVVDLAVGIADRLTERGIEVAHLKLSLMGRGGGVEGKENKAGTGLATGGAGLAAVQ